VGFVGVDELHAAFLNESRTRGRCLVTRAGNPGQARFWLEWDTTALKAPFFFMYYLKKAALQKHSIEPSPELEANVFQQPCILKPEPPVQMD
jgi:hypothetical protein